MGYIRHHAVVVTGGYQDWANRAHDQARKVGCTVTPVVKSPVNGYESFAVVSDGSKEGWGGSDEGDAARDALIAWLREQVYEDGSSPLSWVEVQYGDDELATCVVRSSDHDVIARAAASR